MTRENATKTVAMRFTPTELQEIDRFAREHNFGKTTDWIRTLIRQTIEGTGEDEPSASRKLGIVDRIAQSEEAADLIYQLVAEKLGLEDLRAELAAFSRRTVSSVEELDADLRSTAARLASIPRDPVDEDEMIVQGELPVTLAWNREWTLEEFLALKSDERKTCTFFLMAVKDRSGQVPYYFWCLHSEFLRYLEKLKGYGFSVGTGVVYGASYETPITSANLKHDIETRIVQIVRYVARDSNLGKYETMEDKHLRYYIVRNMGKIPPGLPLEFRFGWVSDAMNAGLVDYPTKDAAEQAAVSKTDTTYRPAVRCRWHYTDEERRELGARKTPFDEQAVPKKMDRYLAY